MLRRGGRDATQAQRPSSKKIHHTASKIIGIAMAAKGLVRRRAAKSSRGALQIAELVGEFDLYNGKELEAGLRKLVEEQSPRLILNFEQCTYFDSSALGALYRTLEYAREYGGNLVLIRSERSAFRIVQLVLPSSPFPVAADEAAAIRMYETLRFD